MRILTLTDLKKAFETAQNKEYQFVGIAVTIPNTDEFEVIINHKANFDEKLDYYLKTYNEDLTHKHAAGIAIVDFAFANTFEEIQQQLLN